jgi:PAT family beta-lactamase induction signal transducer AmpG
VKQIRSFLQIFQSPKVGILTLTGFASGLPFNLTRDTLAAWMTVAGVRVDTIGWLNLVNTPATFKFLWSPLLDRYVPPFLGRRRGWMAVSQVGLMLAIAAMAFQRPTEALQLLAINAIVIAFLSATQDIAIDAYRADVLAAEEVGVGVAVWVLGFRLALIVTGSLALLWARQLTWQGIYLAMAALMGLGVLTSVYAPEPDRRDRNGQVIMPPTTFSEAVQQPFFDFFHRFGIRRGGLILAFVVLYRLSDYFMTVITVPFLVETKFSLEAIGAIRGGMGLVATIAGGLVGGAVLGRIGVSRSLWIFGGLQAVSNLAYWALAIAGKNYSMMVIAVNIENFCGGLGTAAFLGFLMTLCNPRFSATQFALLSSLFGVSRDIIASSAGSIAAQTGWVWFFFLSFCAALPGLLLLPIFAPWNGAAIAPANPHETDTIK